jgi:hypothetical protein
MTQALYAHMNNKTIKKRERNRIVFLIFEINAAKKIA